MTDASDKVQLIAGMQAKAQIKKGHLFVTAKTSPGTDSSAPRAPKKQNTQCAGRCRSKRLAMQV